MTANFSKLLLDTKLQIQEAQQTTSRINVKNNLTYTYHFQTTDNLRQRKYPERSQIEQKQTNTLPDNKYICFSSETLQRRRK